MAESNGSLLPGLWRDSLHVTCGLTAYTPGSAPGPTLGNEYGKTLLYFYYNHGRQRHWNIGGSQVKRRRRENRGAVGAEGVWFEEGLCRFPENL